MKNAIILIVAIILSAAIAGFGVHKYYKAAEQELIASYSKEIEDNKLLQAEYKKQNDEYKKQLDKNNVIMTQQSIEIAKLKGQYTTIKNELITAKDAIKNYTAGEAITFMVDYAQLPGSKMLVQGADTAVIVSSPSVKKIDDIFVEHKYQKVEITNLGNTVVAQSELLVTTDASLRTYRGLLANKDLEIAVLNQNASFNTKRTELTINRLKAQRNRARWTVAGVAGVVIIPTVINALK